MYVPFKTQCSIFTSTTNNTPPPHHILPSGKPSYLKYASTENAHQQYNADNNFMPNGQVA
jgi:hypothetical protein